MAYTGRLTMKVVQGACWLATFGENEQDAAAALTTYTKVRCGERHNVRLSKCTVNYSNEPMAHKRWTRYVVRLELQYHPIIANRRYSSLSKLWVAWCYCLTCEQPQLVLLLEHKSENQSWKTRNTRTQRAGGIATSWHGDVEQKMTNGKNATRRTSPGRGAVI